jgi:hypothetical protein
VAARSRDGVAARSAGVSESSHVGVDAGVGLSCALSRLSEIFIIPVLNVLNTVWITYFIGIPPSGLFQ